MLFSFLVEYVEDAFLQIRSSTLYPLDKTVTLFFFKTTRRIEYRFSDSRGFHDLRVRITQRIRTIERLNKRETGNWIYFIFVNKNLFHLATIPIMFDTCRSFRIRKSRVFPYSLSSDFEPYKKPDNDKAGVLLNRNNEWVPKFRKSEIDM